MNDAWGKWRRRLTSVVGVVAVVPWWVSPINFRGRCMSLVKRLVVKTWREDEGLGGGGVVKVRRACRGEDNSNL
jgi:hypothetical protein